MDGFGRGCVEIVLAGWQPSRARPWNGAAHRSTGSGNCDDSGGFMRSVALVLSLSLFSGAAYAQSGMPNYSTIWNIGDSLSDTGRTFQRTKQIQAGVGFLASAI